LPGENWMTIQETINFVKETLPHSAQFNVAVPYPGTKLYSFAFDKGLLSDMDWRKLYQHKALMRTEQLTAQDLEKARKMAYKMLFFNPRWILNNIWWVLRDPPEIKIGIKYYFKTLKNYLVYQMEHAH
jgi:anaerobic magnesium-protoporphyrin IX monomethyl ester cyclase